VPDYHSKALDFTIRYLHPSTELRPRTLAETAGLCLVNVGLWAHLPKIHALARAVAVSAPRFGSKLPRMGIIRRAQTWGGKDRNGFIGQRIGDFRN